ncbi:MAG: hypothetical protein IIA60_14670 [Candidatus Marinimicrobia bacterium]|nr:hypothetical protein [Candidatus Neomarinimicrobiota bacterium]
MRKILGWLTMALLVGCMSPERAERNLVKAMLALDRTFIPAWTLTEPNSEGDSAPAVQKLLSEWAYFKARFYYYERQDTSWQAALDRVEIGLLQAEEFDTSGNQLAAHASLDEVRSIFVALRDSNGIEYFLDGLIAFQGPLEAIVNLVRGRTAGNLANRQVNAIRGLFPEVRARWNGVHDWPFDPSLHNFDEQQVARLNEQIALENNALDILEQALGSGSRNSIIVAAQGIEPEFDRLYRLFGDFPPPAREIATPQEATRTN